MVVGVATVRWWFLRLHGADRPPRSLLLFGRASLAITVLLGLLIELPEIRHALGISEDPADGARRIEHVYGPPPPDEVFAFVADRANNPKWRSYVIESGWLDDGPMRLGRRGYQTSRILGRKVTAEAVMVE